MTGKQTGVIVAAQQTKEVSKIDLAAMTILLAVSSVSDMYHYRIPNAVVVSGWLAGLAFRWNSAGMAGMGAGIFCIVMSIVFLLPLYGVGGIGAGDVKLLSVVSGVYGLGFWMKTGVVFAVLAAVISIIHMISRKILIKRLRYFFHYIFWNRTDTYYDPERDGREMVVPLAPVLAVAYFIVYGYGIA